MTTLEQTSPEFVANLRACVGCEFCDRTAALPAAHLECTKNGLPCHVNARARTCPTKRQPHTSDQIQLVQVTVVAKARPAHMPPKIVPRADGRVEPVKAMMKVGPTLWRKLHLKMMMFGTLTAENQAEVCRWLKSFGSAIPCGTCASGWASFMKEIHNGEKLPMGTDLFAWSVEIHNRINRKLGRLEMNLEAAKAILVLHSASRVEK